MELYDQHEQSERVRSWLKDNAGAIVTGIVIGLGAIFGYHQWQSHKVRQAYTAAELYERVRVAEAPAATTGGENTGAEMARTELRESYPDSGFAVLTALEQADAQLRAGDTDGARTHLVWAREQTGEEALKTLAGLRLARLELAAGNAEAALAALDSLTGEHYAALRAELRGDAHVALGQGEQARESYLEAQSAGTLAPDRLAMKLSEFPQTDAAVESAGEPASDPANRADPADAAAPDAAADDTAGAGP